MQRYTCVYCGYTGEITKFFILLKSGLYSRKLFKCPDCENTMFHGTLVTRITNRYWGAWVYVNTQLYGKRFNEKVQWKKLKQRIWDYGISKEFWEGFNLIKERYSRLSDAQRNELSILTPQNTQTTLDGKHDNNLNRN